MENEIIESYKAKYGKVYLVTTTVVDFENDGLDKTLEFAFRQPKPLDYDRFVKDLSKKPSSAFKNLVVSCIVDEQRQDLNQTLEDYPAIAQTMTEQLLKLMGLSDEVSLKKL